MSTAGSLLLDVRLTRSMYCHTELRAPWGLEMPPRGMAFFHFIATGAATVHVGRRFYTLDEGDLALLPHGRGHELLSARGVPARPANRQKYRMLADNVAHMEAGGRGAFTLAICAGVRFEEGASHPLLGLLPEIIVVRPRRWGDASLEATLRVLALEAQGGRPGSDAIITRLSDVVVLQVLRRWLEEAPATELAGLAGLRDPRLARVLAAVHADPAADWSVERLAERAAMSRASFAEHFHAVMRLPPMEYVTRWRMHLARRRLRDRQRGVGALARELGYASEAAFSRAFKRVVGEAPAAWRARALTAAA